MPRAKDREAVTFVVREEYREEGLRTSTDYGGHGKESVEGFSFCGFYVPAAVYELKTLFEAVVKEEEVSDEVANKA